MRLLFLCVALAALCLAALAFWLYTPDIGREELEAKYHVQTTDYVALAGIRLHVQDTGPRAAPVIILLHGFGASLQTFDAWSEALSSYHRVVRYDLPGFGLTGPDPTGDYSETRGVTVLAALMDHLGISHATLAGNSMGGKLAWEFAAAHPDRVDKLILISPDGFASPGFEYGRAPTVPLLLRALPYVLPTAMLRMTIAPAYADPKHLTNDVLMRYRDMMLAPGIRRAILRRTAQTVLHDPQAELRRIAAPTLLLWGEQDGMIPVSNAADYQRTIPQAKLVRLPGVGHVPQEEAAAQSLAVITDFLSH